MEERDGDADAVALGVVKALREELAVVDNVVVSEHHALGQASGAATCTGYWRRRTCRRGRGGSRRIEKRRPLGRIEEDGAAKFEREGVTGAAQDFRVIGALVAAPEEEGFHARAREGVLQLVRAVGGIDVDQRGAGTRCAHMHHQPLDAVGGPESDAIAFADAEGPQAAGDAIGLFAELGPGEAARLMAGDDGVAIGKAVGGAVEQVADSEVEQRAVGSAGLALRPTFDDGGGFQHGLQCTETEADAAVTQFTGVETGNSVD